VTQKEKRKEWEEKLLACEASGQTMSALCEAQGISQSSFYYWHKKLNTKEIEQTHPITWLPFVLNSLFPRIVCSFPDNGRGHLAN